MPKISAILADNVKRLVRGRKATAIARLATDLHPSVVRNALDGVIPRAENIPKLAQALGVEESDLFQCDLKIVVKEHDVEECNRRVQEEIKKLFS